MYLSWNLLLRAQVDSTDKMKNLCLVEKWVAIEDLGLFIPGCLIQNREMDTMETFPGLKTQQSTYKIIGEICSKTLQEQTQGNKLDVGPE